MWRDAAIGAAAGLAGLYLALLASLAYAAHRHPGTLTARAALRLVPDVLRLLRRLIRDPAVSRAVRVRLVLLASYLASPIDLVPDVVPVLGYADDLVVVAIALRSVVRHAGPEALDRNWPGTPEGLRAVRRLAGLGDPTA